MQPFSPKEAAMRLVFVDTETTGLSPRLGDRIVELACVEMGDGQLTGNEFYRVINPQQPIPPAVSDIHGIHDAMLQDKPVFAAIATELIDFVGFDSVVMHCAPFDTSFFGAEFARAEMSCPALADREQVIDTLPRFRARHPEERCVLQALCERYGVELPTDERWHGALIDARMLARLWQAAGLSV